MFFKGLVLSGLFYNVFPKMGCHQRTIIKLHKMPAQIADPITPEELQAMACMRRKFSGSSD
jgi:hypothetical protein